MTEFSSPPQQPRSPEKPPSPTQAANNVLEVRSRRGLILSNTSLGIGGLGAMIYGFSTGNNVLGYIGLAASLTNALAVGAGLASAKFEKWKKPSK